jgi:hypothetical protein
MTDTDIRERNALKSVWPRIQLLLCRSHVWQCWKNKINEVFGGVGKGASDVEARKHGKDSIKSMLLRWALLRL